MQIRRFSEVPAAAKVMSETRERLGRKLTDNEVNEVLSSHNLPVGSGTDAAHANIQVGIELLKSHKKILKNLDGFLKSLNVDEQVIYLIELVPLIAYDISGSKKRLRQMLNERSQKHTYQLRTLIETYFQNQSAFDWNKAIKLVKQGADPDVSVFIPRDQGMSVRLLDVYVEEANSGRPLPTDQLKELFNFGLDAHYKSSKWPLRSILKSRLFEYALLFIDYGFIEPFAGWRNDSSALDELVSFIGTRPLTESDHALIYGFLNNHIFLNKTEETGGFDVIVRWLATTKHRDLDDVALYYLKKNKHHLLDSIKLLPDDQALSALKQIFEQKETTLLGKIFWRGNASLSRGRLKEAHDEYTRRLALAEKGLKVEPVINQDKSFALRALLEDGKSLDGALRLLRLGADPATTNSKTQHAHTLLYQFLQNISLHDDNLKKEHVPQILAYFSFNVPLTLPRYKPDDELIPGVIYDFLNQIKPDQLTPFMLEQLKKFKTLLDSLIRNKENAIDEYEKIFDESKPDKKNDTTALGKVMWAGHPDLNKGRLGDVYKNYLKLKYPERVEPEKSFKAAQVVSSVSTAFTTAFDRFSNVFKPAQNGKDKVESLVVYSDSDTDEKSFGL